jgi:hypothetical protein
MTRIPPEDRPSASELANGKSTPNGTCPKCGCAHFEANGTRELPGGTITRYRYCRNPACEARFFYRQPPEQLVREVKPHRDDEKPVLKVRTA